MGETSVRYTPSKEGGDGKCCVESRVGISVSPGVYLACCAQTVECIEGTWAHEANQTQEADLGQRVVV
jgi:hypothetical protein